MLPGRVWRPVTENTTPDRDPSAAALFAGPGEMAALCRDLDWAATPLGPVERWPESLRVATQVVLASGLPNIVLWGPELIQVYNDSYAELIRSKHPHALGRGNQEVWPEVWHINGPIYERVFAGETVTFEDALYPLERRGALEDVYLTISYSPIRGDSGAVGGVLANMIETTANVQRRALEAELGRQNEQLQEAGLELEMSNQQLQDQAAELEAQTVALARTNTNLEQAMAGAELATTALRRSEERYELAARATRNAIWDWNLTNDEVTWNPGVYEVFGYAPGSVVETAEWWYDHIHPDDRERVVTGIHAVINDPAGGTGWEQEYRYRRGDGSHAWVYDRGYIARDATGRSVRMVGAMLDITRQHLLEEDARASARRSAFSADIGIAITTGGPLPAILERCCRAAVEHMDMAHARIWVTEIGAPDGQPEGRGGGRAEQLPTFIPIASAGRDTPRGDAEVPGMYGGVLVERVAEWRRPYVTNAVSDDRWITDGTWPGYEDVVAFAGYPLMVGEEVVGVLTLFAARQLAGADLATLGSAATAISVSISNARLLEREQRARAEAEEANQAKSQFLANMSHELRTPLNAIGGYTDLLSMGLRGPVTDAQEADLTRIRRNQEHLLGVINDILNFARLEAGRVELDLSEVSLRAALEDVEAVVAPQITERGLTYQVERCDESLVVRADREKLQQVIINLLTNASKFTDAPGSITIVCEGGGDTVSMAIQDTGIGIATDRLEHIFDPFVQVDSRLVRAHEGAGLGLAISRDLARRMNGDLTVRSSPGAGSVFTLTLPRTGPARAGGGREDGDT